MIANPEFLKNDQYEDALWVTEAIPLIGYIYSMWEVKKVLKAHHPQELAEHISKHIQRDGGIFNRKNPGLFICKFTN